jgi:hypothetical protein
MASADEGGYAFRLNGGNTAVAPVGDEHCEPGDWIAVWGTGTFDPYAGRVQASGVFKHYRADGTLHAKGTWFSTAFVSFVDFGGPKPNRHGGRLELVVTHVHDGMAHEGLTMTVTSSISAPAGTTPGVTVGPFTVPTGGDSVFWRV